MDNLNFRSLSPEHQAELLQSVPVWRGGRAATGSNPTVAPPGQPGTPAAQTGAALARLFSSF